MNRKLSRCRRFECANGDAPDQTQSCCSGFHSGQPWRAASIWGAGAATWLLYTALRSQILLGHARAIATHSAEFARDYTAGQFDAPALTYLVLGDSTAAGWGAGRLDATYPHHIATTLAARGWRVRVCVRAVGGARARDVAASQLSAIDELRPDLITLSVGANDATHFTAPDEFRRDLTAILTALENSSARTILVADTPDLGRVPALPWLFAAATAHWARSQNAILRQRTRNARFQIVPLYRRGKLKSPDLYAADRFHPSARGYAMWARLFVEKL